MASSKRLFISVSTIVVGLMLSSFAVAETGRALVVMKNSQVFWSAERILAKEPGLTERLKQMVGIFEDAEGGVETSVAARLPSINTIVLDNIDDAEVARLQSNPAVAYVEREVFHPMRWPEGGISSAKDLGQSASVAPVSPDQFQPGESTPWGIRTVKAVEAWKGSHAGKGVRVMILDTGIDQNHPSLVGNFEKGTDFLLDTDPRPYPYADIIGHGTHVAGTIAGLSDQSGFTGVAPQAKILAGRVCGKKGCSNIAIAQGLDWAVAEHVQVVNMSLGGMFFTPLEKAAAERAAAAGIAVVAASGNGGIAKVSYPAAFPEVIAVGAVDVKLNRATFSQYGPELAVVAPGVDVRSSVPQGTGKEARAVVDVAGVRTPVLANVFAGSADIVGAVEQEVVAVGLGKTADFAGINLTGKFALITRGEITFKEKAQNAIAAGAVGVVFSNNEAGLVRGGVTQDETKISIPVFGIEQKTGDMIRQELLAGKVIKVQLQVKPVDYSNFDGTSMASPHVAGVVALIRAAAPGLTPQEVKKVLQETATPLQPNTNNEFGAGLVNAEAAVQRAMQLAH